ncbi:MAG: diaminopimelate epimerase [Deltaproteobacteria bacterium]|nr:diaminopimelate epimerase [Deltaproteobacteria bacterium]MBW1965357.1 diaminopimelate epimerase [Deltaproteobacteria bacterium]
MEPFSFKKMHGSGNDFILVDNREGKIRESQGPDLASLLCRRKFGVGADGLILIENSHGADFKWRFFNADGSKAEMCGNGGRCAARFACMAGIAPRKLSFETEAGIIHADVMGSTVKLQLPQPKDLKLDVPVKIHGETFSLHCLNTGVPHAVYFTQDLESVPILEWGRLIRFDPCFQPAGTNADFVQISDRHNILIRTYERGVENETMACGTGAVASVILSACKNLTENPVKVKTRGGEVLTVYFHLDSKEVRDVFLEGETVLVYSGEINTTAI